MQQPGAGVEQTLATAGTLKLPLKPVIPDPERAFQALLDRTVPPLETVTATVQVFGIYSLPDSWKAKVSEEDLCRYEAQCFGIKVEGGKLQSRQLTEEEKKALEEAQTKGKKPAPPAKGDKKKAEEEPSPEAKAKEEAERKAKEELAAKLKAEWDALDEDTKFYRTQENANKEPRLSFVKLNEKNESVPMVATAELNEGRLAVLEEYVNQEQGCWLVVDKLLPVEEEEGKKTKPKPAGKKAAPGEAERPVRGKAWIKLEDLVKQGAVETEQRVFLQTVIEVPKPDEIKTEEKKEEKKESKKEAKKEAKEEPKKEVNEKVFETAKTYVHLKITLNVPVNPVLPKEGVVKPSDIIKKKAPLPKYPVTKDATEMYKLQLKIAIEALAKEYLKAKNGVGDGPEDEKTSQKRKEDFIEELNRSGKYFMLKEKLKKAVVRIAREKYKKLDSLKGLSKDERDQYYSQLYTHLIDYLHSTIKDMVTTKHQELHEDIVATREIAKKEKDAIMNKVNSENHLQKYRRLFHEYDRARNYFTAEEYLKEIIKLQERDVETWLTYYKFAMKTDNVNKAEDCLREALSIDPDNTDLLLLLGGLLIGRKKSREAVVYLKQVLKGDVANVLGNLLLAVMYDAEARPGMVKKHVEVVKRRRMRELGLMYPSGGLRDSPQLIDGSVRPLTDEEVDGTFYVLADFLAKWKQCDLGEKALGYVQNKQSVRYLFSMAKCRFVKTDYAQALESLGKLLEKEPRHQKALKYKGHALFLQGNFAACESVYLKAIMVRPPPKSVTLYERLGQAYFVRNACAEARVIFMKCCADSLTATATGWKFLGASYLGLGKPAEAEEALTQANVMDNNNAEIWGYIAILCLTAGKRTVQAQQALIEAFRLHLHNVGILREIAEAYFEVGDYEKAVECLKAATGQEPNNGDVWAFMGEAYDMLGEKTKVEAVNCYSRALDLVGDEKKQDIAERIKATAAGNHELSTRFKDLLQRVEALTEPIIEPEPAVPEPIAEVAEPRDEEADGGDKPVGELPEPTTAIPAG